MHPLHQILRDERRVSRHADDPIAVWAMNCAPLERGQDADSGPRRPAIASGTTGMRMVPKREGSPFALRITPSHCGAKRCATWSSSVRPSMRRRRLVATAHPARKAPCENQRRGSGRLIGTVHSITMRGAARLPAPPRRACPDLPRHLLVDPRHAAPSGSVATTGRPGIRGSRGSSW